MKSKPLFRAVVLYVLFCTSPLQGLSQTWTSIMNGDWNAPGTWLLVGIGTPTPPPILLAGMKVNIHHIVTWPTTLSSSLEIHAGAELNINGGIFNVANGVSMKNWGRFIGNRG